MVFKYIFNDAINREWYNRAETSVCVIWTIRSLYMGMKILFNFDIPHSSDLGTESIAVVTTTDNSSAYTADRTIARTCIVILRIIHECCSQGGTAVNKNKYMRGGAIIV